MTEGMTPHSPSQIVLVVGVDLSAVSEHLLSQARDLVRSVELAELHVVHVVKPEPPHAWLTEPLAEGETTRILSEAAHQELERMCRSIAGSSPAKWTVHTPVGGAADELTHMWRRRWVPTSSSSKRTSTPGARACFTGRSSGASRRRRRARS